MWGIGKQRKSMSRGFSGTACARLQVERGKQRNVPGTPGPAGDPIWDRPVIPKDHCMDSAISVSGEGPEQRKQSGERSSGFRSYRKPPDSLQTTGREPPARRSVPGRSNGPFRETQQPAASLKETALPRGPDNPPGRKTLSVPARRPSPQRLEEKLSALEDVPAGPGPDQVHPASACHIGKLITESPEMQAVFLA